MILSPSVACTSSKASSEGALVVAKSAETAPASDSPWVASKRVDKFFGD